MNILILSWRGPKHPNAGGAEQVTLEHAKAWVKTGHKVTWFSSNFVGAEKEEIVSQVKVIRSGKQFVDVQMRAFFWYIFGNHPKLDLVVDQFHGIPFFTPIYVRVKKLAFIHEVAKEVWGLNQWPRPFSYIPAIFGRLGEPLIFKFFYKKIPFMTVSESTKKDLIAWSIPEKNIAVIHNGVNLNLPRPLPVKEKKKTAMFLGAISEDKGIQDALGVFAKIKEKEKDWQFWVVGKSSPFYEEKLRGWVEEHGIKSSFKYWGYVSEKKKFELLARAHVLINPSIREGWGLVNIEANSVGIPIAAYNVAGIKDSVKDGVTGILVDKGDFRSLARGVLKIVENQNEYSFYQKRSISWSKHFTWEKAGRASLELIEGL